MNPLRHQFSEFRKEQTELLDRIHRLIGNAKNAEDFAEAKEGIKQLYRDLVENIRNGKFGMLAAFFMTAESAKKKEHEITAEELLKLSIHEDRDDENKVNLEHAFFQCIHYGPLDDMEKCDESYRKVANNLLESLSNDGYVIVKKGTRNVMAHDITPGEVSALILGFDHNVGELSNDLTRPVTLESLGDSHTELAGEFGNRIVLVASDLDTSRSNTESLAFQLLKSLDEAGYMVVRKPTKFIDCRFENKTDIGVKVDTDKLDPWDRNLTPAQQEAIVDRCKQEPMYFFSMCCQPKPVLSSGSVQPDNDKIPPDPNYIL